MSVCKNQSKFECRPLINQYFDIDETKRLLKLALLYLEQKSKTNNSEVYETFVFVFTYGAKG